VETNPEKTVATEKNEITFTLLRNAPSNAKKIHETIFEITVFVILIKLVKSEIFLIKNI